MKTLFSRFGKWTTISVVIFIVIFLAVILFISPVTKYVIEKNSKEWIGRKVSLNNLSINVFTGKITVKQLQLMEADDKTLFIGLDKGVINVTLFKLIAGIYEITELTMNKLNVNIIQNEHGFNFDDLLVEESTPPDTVASEPVKYLLNNISFTDGVVNYNGVHYEVKQSVSEINISCNHIKWNEPNSLFDVSFSLGTGGIINLKLNIDKDKFTYQANLDIEKLGLGFTEPYLQDFIQIGKFDGYLDSKLIIEGNMNESTDIAGSGSFGLSEILINDPDSDTLFSMGEFIFEFDSLNFKNNLIDLGLIYMDRPFVNFELFEGDRNNITVLMEPDSSEGESDIDTSEVADNPFALLASYTSQLTETYLLNSFSVDSFLIINGRILYTDFTLLDPFIYDFTDLKIECSSFTSATKEIEFNMSSVLNKTGTFESILRVDPNDYYEMDLYYKITGVQLPHVSPYSKYYVAYPFYSGVVQYESTTTIRNKILQSDNKLFIERVELGDKYNHKDAMDLPLKLAIALLRNREGNIDLDLPITGDLNDPDYHIGKIIWQVIKNIIVKAATAPYTLLSNALGVDESQLRGFGFEYLDSTLVASQKNCLDVLIKVINEKPGLNVVISQLNEPALEEIRYAASVTKEMYWRMKSAKDQESTLTESEVEDMNSIKINDSLFVHWVDSIIGQKAFELPVQEKILLIIGQEEASRKVKELENKRNTEVLNYLLDTGADSSRFKVFTVDPIDIPENESPPKFIFTFKAGDTSLPGDSLTTSK